MTQTAKLQIEESWDQVLQSELEAPYFQKLMSFLNSERKAGKIIYPPEPEIFNAFKLTPFANVKCVILGQDPYHGPNQAHGLCFSVKEGKIPPSLRNIYKEIESDLELAKPSHGDLTSWTQQGVLLLNTVLTVEHKKPNSHKRKGWEDFTNAAIQAISNNKDHVVFLLWGKFAQKKAKLIDADKNLILEAPHPAALYGSSGLKDCKHFSKCNTYLTEHGQTEIDWAIR